MDIYIYIYVQEQESFMQRRARDYIGLYKLVNIITLDVHVHGQKWWIERQVEFKLGKKLKILV